MLHWQHLHDHSCLYPTDSSSSQIVIHGCLPAVKHQPEISLYSIPPTVFVLATAVIQLTWEIGGRLAIAPASLPRPFLPQPVSTKTDKRKFGNWQAEPSRASLVMIFIFRALRLNAIEFAIVEALHRRCRGVLREHRLHGDTRHTEERDAASRLRSSIMSHNCREKYSSVRCFVECLNVSEP